MFCRLFVASMLAILPVQAQAAMAEQDCPIAADSDVFDQPNGNVVGHVTTGTWVVFHGSAGGWAQIERPNGFVSNQAFNQDSCPPLLE